MGTDRSRVACSNTLAVITRNLIVLLRMSRRNNSWFTFHMTDTEPAPPNPGTPSTSDGGVPFKRASMMTHASAHAHTAPANPSNSEYGWSGVRYSGNSKPSSSSSDCFRRLDRGGSSVEWSNNARARDRLSIDAELEGEAWPVADRRSIGHAFPVTP